MRVGVEVGDRANRPALRRQSGSSIFRNLEICCFLLSETVLEWWFAPLEGQTTAIDRATPRPLRPAATDLLRGRRRARAAKASLPATCDRRGMRSGSPRRRQVRWRWKRRSPSDLEMAPQAIEKARFGLWKCRPPLSVIGRRVERPSLGLSAVEEQVRSRRVRLRLREGALPSRSGPIGVKQCG